MALLEGSENNMPKANNYPNVVADQLPEAFTAETVRTLRQLNSLGKPRTDAETIQRIDDFFKFCEKTGTRPGIESLCLALSVSRTTLFRWAHGQQCSPEKQEAIEKAKSFIAAFIEQASLRGKLNPATSIFLMKNWLNYKDTVSFEDTTNDKTQTYVDQSTLARIREEYSSLIDEDFNPDESFQEAQERIAREETERKEKMNKYCFSNTDKPTPPREEPPTPAEDPEEPKPEFTDPYFD